MNMFRRLRGMVGTTIVWTLGFGAFGLLYWAGRSLPMLGNRSLLWIMRQLPINELVWLLWGAISGVGFALALTLGDGRHSFAQLSTRRIALWGALGGLLVPSVAAVAEFAKRGPPDFSYLPLFYGAAVFMGSVCAVATLPLARRTTEALSLLAPSTQGLLSGAVSGFQGVEAPERTPVGEHGRAAR